MIQYLNFLNYSCYKMKRNIFLFLNVIILFRTFRFEESDEDILVEYNCPAEY